MIRKGYVIADEYFGGWTADSIHTEQSVTKSVTSLVTGIAIARGDLQGVNQRGSICLVVMHQLPISTTASKR